MRVTYSTRGKAAYIYLKDIEPGEAVLQHRVEESHARGEIILDFDKKGRLIGIEVLDAMRGLPQGFLDSAERI